MAPAVAAAAPAQPSKPVAGTDDDDDFDLFDLFDDDGDDEDEADDSDEADDDEDAAGDDDDDDDDDTDDSDEAESEEETAADDEGDAIDLFGELLDDDEETTPKPAKPVTAAPAAAAAAQESGAAEISVVPLADEKPPKKAVQTPEIEVTVNNDEDESYDDEAADEGEEDVVRKPTPKPVKSTNNAKPAQGNPLLPLLTIQNTPALLELQQQLIGNTKNKPIVETKPKKKKKTKGTVKKQAAILSNEIGEGDNMENKIELTESPIYELKVKKTENKPEVIVEGPIMEKIKLVTKNDMKKKMKPLVNKEPMMTKQESEELNYDEEATTLSS